jgi:hypothetical protein
MLLWVVCKIDGCCCPYVTIQRFGLWRWGLEVEVKGMEELEAWQPSTSVHLKLEHHVTGDCASKTWASSHL